MNIFAPKTRFGAVCCALSLLVSFVVGCTPKENPEPKPDPKPQDVAVTDVTLSQSTLSLAVGGSASLTAKVSPDNATNKTVTWSSSKSSVATVSNGTVTAVAEGEATITAKAGDKSATCKVTVTKSQEETLKAGLMKLYNALDGPHWKTDKKWDMSKPLSEWEGIEIDKQTGEIGLALYPGNFGLKGQLPDCFDELTPLTKFFLQNEPGVTGTLPPSFAKLKNLKNLTLVNTSMTSLPDLFEGMPMEEFYINGNKLMTGPIPESPAKSPKLRLYMCMEDAFTGTVPDSFAQLGTKLTLRSSTLDGRVPDSFATSKYAGYLVNMYLHDASHRTSPMEVGDYDIPAFWPDYDLKDLVTNKVIPFKDIYSKNKVTVLLNWATWCPYSPGLLQALKRMYEKYHKDGLEIISGFNSSNEVQDSGKPLKDVILEKGYDKWYNFTLWNFEGLGWDIWCNEETPSAILVDNKGNILASNRSNVSDPSRNRFGYTASTRLIPVLENIFGPMDNDDYSSTDYSQDGKVITVQKATVGKGINLVIMGDAYTDKDIADGTYERVMTDCADALFNIEPYKTFRNRFNVYIVKVVSKHGKTGPGYETALGSQIYNGNSITGDEDKVYKYALKVSGISKKDDLTIAVMVNSYYAGGVASMNETLQSGIGYCPSFGNDWTAFGPIVRHEVGGHAFAFLGDEYAHHNETPSQAMINENNRLYNKYGWYANLDFTNDTKKVRWADFLSDSRYKDEVGIYEGGNNMRKGVYRPSENSMMRDNLDYFNAPSRWAIYKRIMTLSGESYTFNKFLTYDAVNRGAKPAGAPATRSGEEVVHGAPPVVTR